MKRIILGLIFITGLSGLCRAEGTDWKGYYDKLLKGLKSKVQQKFESKTRVSAVAAVRGAKQGSDANALYWKGGLTERASKQLNEDKAILTSAIELVVSGKVSEGRIALEKFIKDKPESFYLEDAKEALSKLPKEAAKPAETKTPVDAAKPEPPAKK